MRKLTVLLMLLVAVSFANDVVSALADGTYTETINTGYVAPMPLDKAVLFDNAYDGTIYGGYQYYASHLPADDFSLTNPSLIENIEWWGLYCNAPTGGDYQLRFYDDNSGSPGTILWEKTYNPTLTDTGDDYGGGSYDIYHVEVVLDPADYFLAEDATAYWLALYIPSGDTEVYWCVWNGGNIHYSTDDGGSWTNWGNDGIFRLNGTKDLAAPEVSGQNPADGATGVAVTSNIVFHVTDDCFGVDTSTISFSVEDSAKSSGASLSSIGHTGAITGTLVVDDTDPCDVICTFTPDSNLPPDTITCTVAAGLADDVGNATTADIVWSFDTTGSAVEETTWGQIKAIQ